jgi:hypothetical protein
MTILSVTAKYHQRFNTYHQILSQNLPKIKRHLSIFSELFGENPHVLPILGWKISSHPPSPISISPFFGDMGPSLGKGYGKGAFGAPKEAKGLVRAVVSAQVVPGGKWNNDDNTSPGRDGGMGGWGTGDGGKGRHIHIYIYIIYM